MIDSDEGRERKKNVPWRKILLVALVAIIGLWVGAELWFGTRSSEIDDRSGRQQTLLRNMEEAYVRGFSGESSFKSDQDEQTDSADQFGFCSYDAYEHAMIRYGEGLGAWSASKVPANVLTGLYQALIDAFDCSQTPKDTEFARCVRDSFSVEQDLFIGLGDKRWSEMSQEARNSIVTVKGALTGERQACLADAIGSLP